MPAGDSLIRAAFFFLCGMPFLRSAAHTGYIDQLRNSTFICYMGRPIRGFSENIISLRHDKAPGLVSPYARIFKSFTLPPAFAVESAVVLC